MTNRTLRIQKFSKVVYILLRIALVASIIAVVYCTIAWMWELLQLHTETIFKDNGLAIEAPVLFQIGNMRVIMPFVNVGNSEAGIYGMDFWLQNLLEAILTVVALIFAKRVFNLLRGDGNPFRKGIVNSFKKLAIALLFVGIFTGAVGFISAAIVWVLYLIFDYGCALQHESDSTL